MTGPQYPGRAESGMLQRLTRLFGRARQPSPRRATGALADFYRTPPPAGSTRLADLPVLAVDIETTGLDAKQDSLLSIGWVPLNGRRIDLAGAGEVVLAQQDDEPTGPEGDSAVGESATVHGLTDDVIAGGVDPVQALTQLLDALQGRAMLVHFATMETTFLTAACLRQWEAPLDVPVIDTLELERRNLELQGSMPRGEDLRLPRVRERYGLPVYRSHRAVTDALACAELYLAITAPHDGQKRYRTLRSVT